MNKKSLLKHKQKSEQQNIVFIKTSNESQKYLKIYCHKVRVIFSIHADFDSDYEFDNSIKENKITVSCKQNPKSIDYYVVPE